MPRPDRSRTALVESAALLFRRQGYAATGVNQILEAADVKAGSLTVAAGSRMRGRAEFGWGEEGHASTLTLGNRQVS